ncbi:MAG: ABC transporter substrate-binding protein [Anaerolineales bacterium]|nr:ABC transporter substrate-binding protein [Anaerolineales bacterium]
MTYQKEMMGTVSFSFPRFPIFALGLSMFLFLAACVPATLPTTTTKVTLMLDWVPNTNHTGLFVARDKGYFAAEGLEVEIIQPGEVFAEQAVASGVADFGVSFQEQVTLARADNVPLVSIAAIIQNNTSGFASRATLNVQSAAQYAGLKYGSFGSPFEAPTLKALMKCAGGDFSQLQIVETGFSDPLALLSTEQIDMAWIFYGWQGVQAEQQGIPLNYQMLADHTDCIPDYYTPVIIASEKTIAERPAVVRAFMKAVSRGYVFAIENPTEAGDVLLKAAPELDATLVQASQAWLSPRYQAEAARWGEQKQSVWETYAAWMQTQGIITQPLNAGQTFTNEFLP